MSDRMPFVAGSGGGGGAQGVQVQRKVLPMSDKRPALQNGNGSGIGVQVQRDPDKSGPGMAGKLSSPFPYYGGKSRWIDTVWQRIGKVGVWSEPCCGTAVMTLNNPFPAPREVICELNAFICNFYRSLRADPDAVAYHADWPTNHHDLTARHRWLLAQGPELRERMVADPDDFDAKIAGWWVWGQSSWIGHGWCDDAHFRDGMPYVGFWKGGRGVNMGKVNLPVEDKRPKVPDGGGSGVSAQRDRVPRDGMPQVKSTPGGRGVSLQRTGGTGNGIPAMPELGGNDGILDGFRLRPWFRAIAERLARVIILNRSWQWALTDSVLQQTPSSPKPSVGVFLDPPYRTVKADGTPKRSTGLYQGDKTGESDAIAKATYEWATEGRNKLGERYCDKYRIAYCMHEGDFLIPPGWTAETMGFSGHRDAKKKADNVDQVMFSPACVSLAVDPQLGFDW